MKLGEVWWVWLNHRSPSLKLRSWFIQFHCYFQTNLLWNNYFSSTHLFSYSGLQIVRVSLQPSRRRRLKKLLLFSSAMTWQRSSTAAWSEPAPRATLTCGPITILFVRLRVLAGQQTSGLGESALKCRCKVCSITLLPGFWQMWVSIPF